jgi:hypothetical protein
MRDIYRYIAKNGDIWNKTPKNTPNIKKSNSKGGTDVGTPSCQCEGCKFLDTRLGHALLDYAVGFISEIASTVRQGKAKADDELHVQFHGPDADKPDPLLPGRQGKTLSTFDGTVGEVADMVHIPIAQRPDLDTLRAVYWNDPVVQGLLDWMEVRYAK